MKYLAKDFILFLIEIISKTFIPETLGNENSL